MRVETAEDSPCEVEQVGKLVFGKWTSHLLWALAHDGPMSFNQCCASAPRATPKVITARLRQLERDGLIARRRFREAPPRTEYQITPLARSLIPVFRELVHWWQQNLAEVSQARTRYDAGTNTPHPVLAADSQILQALWTSTPARSSLNPDNADRPKTRRPATQ